MLQIKQSDTTAELILTLFEKQDLVAPNYLFYLYHTETRIEIFKVFLQGEDFSNNKPRYNHFNINPSVLFLDKPIGEWQYRVYEQQSESNLSVIPGMNLLESGKLMLLPEFENMPSIYHEETLYKAYAG